VTSTPKRPVYNVIITTKGLQDRNIHIIDGTSVENKGKLILSQWPVVPCNTSATSAGSEEELGTVHRYPGTNLTADENSRKKLQELFEGCFVIALNGFHFPPNEIRIIREHTGEGRMKEEKFLKYGMLPSKTVHFQN
jgi:hypothetical protein